jgi:hypothetical protein
MEAAPTPVRTHLEEQTASAPLVSCLEMTGRLVKVHSFSEILILILVCEAWFFALREERGLKEYENKVLGSMFQLIQRT